MPEEITTVTGYSTLEFVKEFGKITTTDDDELLRKLINASSDFFDSVAKRYPLGVRLHNHEAVEWFDTKVTRHSYFPQSTPVISITKLEVYDRGTKLNDYAEHSFVYSNYIMLTETLPTRSQGLKATFQTGFFAEGEYPDDLKVLITKIVVNEYKRLSRGEGEGVKSKTIGRYKIEYTQAEVQEAGVQDFEAIVSRYRKPINFGVI